MTGFVKRPAVGKWSFIGRSEVRAKFLQLHLLHLHQVVVMNIKDKQEEVGVQWLPYYEPSFIQAMQTCSLKAIEPIYGYRYTNTNKLFLRAHPK